MATSGDGTRILPGTPFTLPEYQLEAQTESECLMEEAENAPQRVRECNQVSDNFILITVLFASVLFLSGIQSKIMDWRVRGGILMVAIGIFVLGFAILLSLPVSFGS